MRNRRVTRCTGLVLLGLLGACRGPSTATADGSPRAERESTDTQHLKISGIYPHLATHNQPEDVSDRPKHGECGIGAVVPWAGRLWYITYPQHKTTGSNDKLYEVAPDMSLTVRPESVGGTHACRMIHQESNQLIIGPYFIDREGNVRSPDLNKLRGRMTAIMRHLTDPTNKVYFFDMEGAIYEVDVHDLAVKRLFTKPVPGWHGKGGYTAQGRVVIANNGESGSAYRHLLAGAAAVGEEAGALAEWDGDEWRIIERKQFCDVTGPGGIRGSRTPDSPLWATGWDKRSVILKLLDGGNWSTYRLPKASHTFDPRHGWFTEWPRIREIAPDRPMMCMHGSMLDFPVSFRSGATGGVRPICTHLRYVPDFCHWKGQVVIGADDSSMMANPMCGQGQSNLWFGSRADLGAFGPRAGWGGVWLEDKVSAGETSVPFLLAGYEQRTLHLTHDKAEPVRFDLEIDRDGKGQWVPYRSVTVPASGYTYSLFPADEAAEWVRVKAGRSCRATAYFHFWSPRPHAAAETSLFKAVADATTPGNYSGGLIRPAAHNQSLQWVSSTVSDDGKAGDSRYLEIDLERTKALSFLAPDEDRTEEVRKVARVQSDFAVDEASVIVRDDKGRRYRLPRGPAAFDREFPTGVLRGVREVVSERHLANFHGTFYEIPRSSGQKPDFQKMKPVSSHGKLIADFCTWRGLLVISGTRLDASPDGHYFSGSGGAGLWFGAVDDIWKLGKPTGRGGPWLATQVRAGEPSDPYLMTGYDQKRVEFSHEAKAPVRFTLQVDFDHAGFRTYRELSVPPGEKALHAFPRGFHAHWVRVLVDRDCKVTAQFTYE